MSRPVAVDASVRVRRLSSVTEYDEAVWGGPGGAMAVDYYSYLVLLYARYSGVVDVQTTAVPVEPTGSPFSSVEQLV